MVPSLYMTLEGPEKHTSECHDDRHLLNS